MGTLVAAVGGCRLSVRCGHDFSQLLRGDEPITIQVHRSKHPLNLLQITWSQLNCSQQQSGLNKSLGLCETLQATDSAPLGSLCNQLGSILVRLDPLGAQNISCRRAISGFFLQKRADEVARILRPLAPAKPRRELHAVIANGSSARVNISAVKWNRATKKHVHGHSERPQIGRIAERLLADNLWSHVVDGASHLTDHVRSSGVKNCRESEVNHLDGACIFVLTCEHDIVWLHITVNDAHAVTVGHCHQGLPGNLRHKPLGQHLVRFLQKLLAITARKGLQNQIHFLVTAV
mmetsp:Transcript_41729/g.88390  ORF Transcript_41729/g.88390 Transcript_41729/m.88390 type:complete len:291 (-) Transcript_41729:450-1322(-)